jgi:hypothetical protein
MCQLLDIATIKYAMVKEVVLTNFDGKGKTTTHQCGDEDNN